MKQKLKGGFEYDCTSRWRKKGTISAKAGVWKYIKRKMNKRFRKEGKDMVDDITHEEWQEVAAKYEELYYQVTQMNKELREENKALRDGNNELKQSEGLK